MARRGMAGQLNMFDFYRNLDGSSDGEVEMVSLMPWEEEPVTEESPAEEDVPVAEELPVAEETPVEAAASLREVTPKKEIRVGSKQDKSKPVRKPSQEESKPATEFPAGMCTGQERVAMSRTYETAGTTIEIAYVNYNKVRVTKGEETPVFYEFTSSKEAVDFYVEQMHKFEPDEE